MKASIKFLYMLLLLGVTHAHAQELSCRITDSGGEPVAYANIYAPQKGSGAVSDARGQFTLNIGNMDTLVFSCIGYEEKIMLAGELRNAPGGCRVVLEATAYVFPSVEVKTTRYRNRKTGLDMRSEAVQIWLTGDDEQLGREIGTVMANTAPCFIDRVGFNLIEVSFDSLFYEVNIYALDGGNPGHYLNRNRIFGWISRENAHKSIEIDVSEQRIFVEGDFFVSVEAIRVASGAQRYAITFPGSLFGKKSLQKSPDGRWTQETTVSIYAKMKCVK